MLAGVRAKGRKVKQAYQPIPKIYDLSLEIPLTI